MEGTHFINLVYSSFPFDLKAEYKIVIKINTNESISYKQSKQ